LYESVVLPKLGIQKYYVIFLLALAGFLVCSFSLRAEEESSKEPYRLAAQQFIDKARPLYGQDIHYGLKSAETLITEAATPENLEQVFLVLNYYYALEDKEKMRAYADQLAALAQKLDRPDMTRLVEIYRSYTLALDGDYSAAIRELEAQLKTALEIRDHLAAVMLYDALALLEPFQGEFYIALQYAEKATRLLRHVPYEKRLRLHLYNTLTYVYTELEDLDKTLEFANLALDMVKETGLYMDISTVVYNVGLALQSEKSYVLADRYLEELLIFYKESGQAEQNIYPYYGLALNAYEQKKYPLSLSYVERALLFADTSEDFAVSLRQLGAELYALTGQVDKARDYRSRVEAFFSANPSYQNSQWANLNLRMDAEIAYAEGRYKDAYRIFAQYNEKALAQAEKSFSNDVYKLRAGLEATMRIEKAEQGILLERGELKIQQMMFLVGAFLVVLVVVLGALVVQRRTVVALEKSQREAEDANQSKTEFLANMSHELRTPLNAIIGFSEMMTGKVYGPLGHENYDEYADMINSSGHHLLNIISDILDMSKVENGALALHELECDLVEFVQAAIRVFADQARDRDIALQLDAPDNLPLLSADLRILNQILYNALSNALKFNRQGGRIEISLMQKPDTGGMRITVSDTGIGMTEEELVHVMKPFAQVQNSLTRAHEGTGLGLPLMAAFMKLHGGTLDVTSEKDQGTTLIMDFPPSRTL
tara:strand:- start:2821 stop:4956 length:2136 start_codon:yes stop_codon:yes gene_type:complete